MPFTRNAILGAVEIIDLPIAEAETTPCGAAASRMAACFDVDLDRWNDAERARAHGIIADRIAGLADAEQTFLVRFAEDVGSQGAGEMRAGETSHDHLERNLADPYVRWMLLCLSDDIKGLAGIHDVLLDATLDADGRLAAVEALADASAWIDWYVFQGQHPSDTSRFYSRFDGEKRWYVAERGGEVSRIGSKWARWTEAVAMIMTAFPHHFAPYEEALRLEWDVPYGQPTPLTSARWKAIEAETAAWRAETLTFYDPFKPHAQQVGSLFNPVARPDGEPAAS